MNLTPLYRYNNAILVGLESDYKNTEVKDGLVVEIDLRRKEIVTTAWSGQLKLKFGFYYAVELDEKNQLKEEIKNSFSSSLITKIELMLLNPSKEAVASLIWLPNRLKNKLTMKTSTQTISEVLTNTIADFESEKETNKRKPFVTTGFNKLDKIIGGFKKGSLSVIAARPGMGKSSLTLGMAYNIAKQGTLVGYISTERTPKELLYQIAANQSAVPLDDFIFGSNEDNRLEVLKVINNQLEIPLVLGNKKIASIDAAIADCKNMGIQGAEVIFVDCLQMLTSYYEFDSVEKEMSDSSTQVVNILNRLSDFAHKSNVAVVVTSQISIRVEWRGGDKKPNIHDIRWAEYMEEIAETIMLLYRAEYYGLDEDENGNSTDGVAEIIVDKNGLSKRDICYLQFNYDIRWFYE